MNLSAVLAVSFLFFMARQVYSQCTDTLVLRMADMQQIIIDYNSTITELNAKISGLNETVSKMAEANSKMNETIKDLKGTGETHSYKTLVIKKYATRPTLHSKKCLVNLCV